MLIPNCLGTFPIEKKHLLFYCCSTAGHQRLNSPSSWSSDEGTSHLFKQVKKWKCISIWALNDWQHYIAQRSSDDLILCNICCLLASFGLQLEHPSVPNLPWFKLLHLLQIEELTEWLVWVSTKVVFFLFYRVIIIPTDLPPKIYCISAQQRLTSWFASSEHISCLPSILFYNLTYWPTLWSEWA